MKAKRFLALLLSVVMLLGVMPMSVFAVEHVHDYTYSYTYIDGSKQHYGVCFCGEADSSNPVGCTYNDGVPGWNKAPSEDSEGKRTWECTLCHGEWQETVPAHKCTHNDIWEQDDYRYHCTHCVYPGCGAWMGEEHTNYMTGWVHEDATTLKNSCTRCGYFNSSTVESSFAFVEAKGATCSSAGNIEFYICEHCDKYFADETCQKQYNPAEVFINPTAHNYVDGVCTECSAKVTSARFEQTPEEYFSSDDEYLYVFVGMGSDGKLYAMGEATGDGRRYGVEIPGAQIDENGVITLTPAQAEFMLYEYYFENGSGASTTSTFTVDGGYMTIKNGKIYVFPKSHLDDPENPRPIDFDQADYGDDSGLGSVDADDYDPSTYTHTYEYMTFNPETLCFEACDTEQNTIYLYRQICDHANEDVVHYEHIAATCTEQGTREYWYCSKCFTYFSNAACTQKYEFPDDIDPNDSIAVAKYFQINALCHKFAENGVCEHCAMKRNVYKPITSLEQFDQLSGEAYYIIVFKDGDKTYAAFLPDIGHINDPVTIDANNNGIVDMMEPDVNANGIPDCIESYIDEYMGSVDYNEDGIKSVEEYNEMIGWTDDDEDIDADDYKLFFENRIYWDLYYEYDYEIYDLPNIVEVTVAPDGSITIVDEGAMEFQMMPSGIWGGQENDGSELEYENIKDTDRLRAFWVPNWWIANSGTMGEYSEDHFLAQDRVFGDRAMPGVIDNKNWKISFKEDGTALLVSTWTEFDDSAALQLIKYTDADGNERITMIGCYDYLWKNSEILSNCTVISGVYLYASEPVYAEPPHECIWSDWKADDVTDTHTRTCTVEGCDKKQTENHNWDNGVETEAPSCTENGTITYTCPDCNATKTEPIPALDHDFGDFVYDSVDSHIRYCKRENCGAEDFGGHEWGDWVSVDENTHKMTCSVCNGYQTDDHDFDNGVVTKEPTEWEEGVKTYTCGLCSHTKTESIDKLVHECTWTDWYPNGDENHKRDCIDDNCDKFETEDHDWDDGEITKEPTCKETGVKTYTCQTCMHTRTEDIPTIDHEFGDWIPNDDGETHSRFCNCGESETDDHKFDDGEVTQAPTHQAVGEVKYTCGDCGYFYMADIPTTSDHEWGEWVINKLDEANTHIRFCICDESQTAPHNFDEGEVTEEATHTSKGVKTFTCGDCGYTYDEEIPTTPDHEWTDWSPNGDGMHTRACRCNANETKDCTYDDGVVTEEPTHVEPGTKLFTCTVCGYTYEEDIPVLPEHEWGDWVINKLDEANTHIRFCICNESQTAPHNFDEGVVTTEATHTSKGVKTYTCGDCGYTYDEEIPTTPDHEWTDWSPNSDGTHTRACRCNANETKDCEWDDGKITTEPTHYEEGVKTFTCTVCGGEKTESVSKTTEHEWTEWTPDNDGKTHTRLCKCGEVETKDHNFDEGTVTKEPTHLEEGVKKFTCADCGFVREEMIAKTPEHTFGEWKPLATVSGKHYRECACGEQETADCAWDDGEITTEPTHYEEGVKTFTCTVCDGEKIESVPKTTEHEWTEWTPDNDGKTHTRLCKCGASETKDHNFDEGKITKEPTHLEEGVKKFTCGDCGFVREDVLNKTPEHTFGEWKPEATVVGKHYRECACGEREIEDCEWDDGKITTEPTHYEEGVKTFTCTVCGGEKTESIAKTTAHEWTEWTPDNDGKTHTRLCKCGASETKDHSFDAGIVTKEPTHLEEGVKKFTCSDCGFVREEMIAKTPEHTFGEWKPEATVVDKHYRECACGEQETADCAWDNGKITTEPTHYEEGVKTFTCTICDGEKTESLPKTTEHEWTDWTPDNDGKTHTRLCKCGASDTKDHNFDEGKITKEPTHLEEGVKKFTCGDCGFVREDVLNKTPEHTFGEWKPEATVVGKHYRECACGEQETADCAWDEGKVTTEPTHYEEGVKTFTCIVCGGEKTESIPKTTEHEWSDWAKKDDKSHIRECKCGEIETSDHEFGEEEIVLHPTDNSIHVKSVCSICGYEKDVVAAGTVVSFTNCEGLSENPLVFVQGGDEATFALKLPNADDIDAREGYKLVGWIASIDGVSYSAGTELFIAYADASTITFTAEWAAIIGDGEQKLAANQAYTTDMDAFEIEGEGIIYQGDQVFYVPKDEIYVLIESKNDEEVE